jgi:2EXR family
MSAFNLASLGEALPDPDLQLYPQTPIYNSFNGFLWLPLKIRMMIWDLVRPRRVLAILDNNGILCTRTPPPVTFRVCSDSRSLTMSAYQVPSRLSDYTLIHNVEVKQLYSALHLSFFDPKADTLILHRRNPNDASCYFQHTTSSIAEDLTDIRSLEVRRFDWALLMFRGWNTWSHGFNPQFTYFRCFRGLEKLTIVGGGHGLRTEQEQDECKAAFKRVFEAFHALYPDYKIPEVAVKMI